MKNNQLKKENEFIKKLMDQMTLDEKIGQLYESNYDGGYITGPQFENNDVNQLIKKGLVGSIIGQYDNKVIYNLQKSAVDNTRLHIPLFFSNDIIHGCRTIFPIPLAMSCSWNPKLVESAASVAAKEASHSGVNVTFSPMVDLVRDPRWGRVMESNGEDPYLSSKLSKAYVKGYQGSDLKSENCVAACVKHYAGYGASEAGRDYNLVDMSLDTFYNYYLPPFEAAVKNKVSMVMSSFNTFNGIPSTCNKFLLRDTLKGRLKFDGVVISDYSSSEELIKHKVCIDLKEVAYKTMMAGLDHEMASRAYIDNLKDFKNDPIILKYIDDSVSRILRLKYRLGLFDNPYKAINIDFEKYWLKDEYKEMALKAAEESICLLENRILPLSKKDKVLFVGPFIDTKQVIGAWSGKADKEDAETLLNELKKTDLNYDYFKGCDIDSNLNLFLLDEKIQKCDKIVLILGENQWMSGENQSKTNLDLPSVQLELMDYVTKFNKPIVLLIHSGRPLILTKIKKYFDEHLIDAVGYLWFLGTMSSKAIINTIFGDNNPSGKITMSFPYNVGQIPVYYNTLPTGRPLMEGVSDDYLTRYLDAPNEALYPFGYGLSYSKFIYKNLILKDESMEKQLSFSVEVLNDSDVAGYETIEIYIECMNDIVSRPVNELKSFKKLWFKPHETKVVEFTLKRSDLNYYVFGKKHIACGKYGLKVGPNSRNTIVKYFNVI